MDVAVVTDGVVKLDALITPDELIDAVFAVFLIVGPYIAPAVAEILPVDAIISLVDAVIVPVDVREPDILTDPVNDDEPVTCNLSVPFEPVVPSSKLPYSAVVVVELLPRTVVLEPRPVLA
jgi:hypothetical protein